MSSRLITVATVSFLAYNLSKKSVERRQRENLNILIEDRVDKIRIHLSNIYRNASLISGSELTKSTLATNGEEADSLLGYLMSSSSETDLKTYLNDVNSAFEYDEIMITGLDLKIKYTTKYRKSLMKASSTNQKKYRVLVRLSNTVIKGITS